MKKITINGIIPEIEVHYQPPYEEESEYQEGRVYTGKEILDSGIIEKVKRQGYICWLVGDFKINPNNQYIFWLHEEIDPWSAGPHVKFCGVRRVEEGGNDGY
jgi:hypothetical protein